METTAQEVQVETPIYKLWIDDIRPAPDSSWDIARTYAEAIDKLYAVDRYDEISFDNDLGTGNGEGYQIVDYLEAAVVRGELRRPRVCMVHSMNPVAKARMKATLRRFTNVR